MVLEVAIPELFVTVASQRRMSKNIKNNHNINKKKKRLFYSKKFYSHADI